MSSNEPKCKQEKRDCESYREGYCRDLWNTNFKRDCPFYKKRKEKEK